LVPGSEDISRLRALSRPLVPARLPASLPARPLQRRVRSAATRAAEPRPPSAMRSAAAGLLCVLAALAAGQPGDEGLSGNALGDMMSKMQSRDPQGMESLMMGLAGMGDQGSMCPEGQVPAPAEGHHKAMTANGCGPQGLQIKEPHGLYRCCNFHDVCFSACGTTHEWCEKEFKRCMRKTCKQPDSGDKPECKKQAETFSSLSGAFGKGFHSSSQKMSCKCMDKAEAAGQHMKFLVDFLGQYDPEAEGRAGAYLEKWRGKEGELYALLVRKYGRKFVKFTDIDPDFEKMSPKYDL